MLESVLFPFTLSDSVIWCKPVSTYLYNKATCSQWMFRYFPISGHHQYFTFKWKILISIFQNSCQNRTLSICIQDGGLPFFWGLHGVYFGNRFWFWQKLVSAQCHFLLLEYILRFYSISISTVRSQNWCQFNLIDSDTPNIHKLLLLFIINQNNSWFLFYH